MDPLKRKTKECPTCKKQLSSAARLRTHIDPRHADTPRPIYTCACICGNTCTFQSKQGLVSHHAQRYVHEGMGYVCAHCGEVNMSKQMLDSHMASNHGGAKFTCGVCQSANTHPSTLSAHIQKDHKDPDNQVPCLANGYDQAFSIALRMVGNKSLLGLKCTCIAANTCTGINRSWCVCVTRVNMCPQPGGTR